MVTKEESVELIKKGTDELLKAIFLTKEPEKWLDLYCDTMINLCHIIRELS